MLEHPKQILKQNSRSTTADNATTDALGETSAAPGSHVFSSVKVDGLTIVHDIPIHLDIVFAILLFLLDLLIGNDASNSHLLTTAVFVLYHGLICGMLVFSICGTLPSFFLHSLRWRRVRRLTLRSVRRWLFFWRFGSCFGWMCLGACTFLPALTTLG